MISAVYGNIPQRQINVLEVLADDLLPPGLLSVCRWWAELVEDSRTAVVRSPQDVTEPANMALSDNGWPYSSSEYTIFFLISNSKS